MSLDDLSCEICGMRYGDVRLYEEHVAVAHGPAPTPGDRDDQAHTTGLPTGSTVREDI